MPTDVSQMRKLARDLRRAADQLPDRASKMLRKAGFDIERISKSTVVVVTGNLKNSIGVEIVDDLTVVIGPTAAYGAYVEFGTSKMSPRPYMNPATDRVVPGLAKAMTKLVKL